MTKVVSNKKIVIVGGGITGLTAAYLLASQGAKVTLVEGSKKIGGLLNTFNINGAQLESYYHHFFTHDAEINWLLEDLGLKEDLIFRATTMGVYRDGRLYKFDGIGDLFKFKPIGIVDKIRFGLSSLYLGMFANWKKYESISALEWFGKWAGRSTTSSLWEPMLKVKFGPYADRVPLAWMIGRLRQRLGSRKNGDEKLGYLKGSLSSLLEKLKERLDSKGVEIVLDARLEEVKTSNSRVESIIAGGRSISGDQFLLTAPGIFLGPQLKNIDLQLAEKLNTIEYFGAICVILELDRKLSDFYWLNIADPDFPFGGIIEHTNFIDSSNYGDSHIVYLSRYFAWQESIMNMSEKEISDLMISYLPKIFPEFSLDWLKNILVFKTRTAATVCDLNFSSKVPNCQSHIENLYTANMSHVYPDERSVNNSIRIAAEACKKMGFDTSFVKSKQSLSAKIGF